MENKKLVYASDVRKAILRADPKLAYVIDNVPAVDAVEAVHARWINIKEYGSRCFGFCSDCAAVQKATNATALRAFHRYCRWCGAKMDGDGNG